MLARLAARGVQVIDLEGLANHRGSLFGAMPGGQPAQKLFESRLAGVLARLDPARPVVVEAESSRIGDRSVPRAMWKAICAAPRLRLAVPVAARADFTARAYADAVDEPGRMVETVRRLARLHAAEKIDAWTRMAERGDWAALAEALMRDHYDPRYLSHRSRYAHMEIGAIEVTALDDRGLEAATSAVEAALDGAPFRGFVAPPPRAGSAG